MPSCVHRSLAGLSQEMFQFGEGLLDRVEVWGVGRQEEQLRPGGADSPAHRLAFMAAEIVEDDDVAGRQPRHQETLDVNEEAGPVDRSINDAWRLDTIDTQGCHNGHGAPMAVWRLLDEAIATPAPAAQARHVCLGPGLVDEDEALGVKPGLVGLPPCAPPGDVGSVLFGGVQDHPFES